MSSPNCPINYFLQSHIGKHPWRRSMADMQPNNFQQPLGHCRHPTALIICFLGNVIQIHRVGASKNRGTPKSSILIGFSIINHPFWGTPIFGNTHVTEIPLFFRNCFFPPKSSVWGQYWFSSGQKYIFVHLGNWKVHTYWFWKIQLTT